MTACTIPFTLPYYAKALYGKPKRPHPFFSRDSPIRPNSGTSSYHSTSFSMYPAKSNSSSIRLKTDLTCSSEGYNPAYYAAPGAGNAGFRIGWHESEERGGSAVFDDLVQRVAMKMGRRQGGVGKASSLCFFPRVQSEDASPTSHGRRPILIATKLKTHEQPTIGLPTKIGSFAHSEQSFRPGGSDQETVCWPAPRLIVDR
jgi:hypothetical protein